MLNFEEWRRTRKWVVDIGDVIQDEGWHDSGFVYEGGVFIMDLDHTGGTYICPIGRQEYDGALCELEPILYRYCVDEGLLADTVSKDEQFVTVNPRALSDILEYIQSIEEDDVQDDFPIPPKSFGRLVDDLAFFRDDHPSFN